MPQIKGYQVNLDHAIRCDGCGVIVGPDAPVKNAYKVVDGIVKGTFHSRACYDAQLRKALQEEGGEKDL